jgi:hypothetical protein
MSNVHGSGKPPANRLDFSTGERFGSRVVVERTDQRRAGGAVLWRVRCDCGREDLVLATHVRKRESCAACAGRLRAARRARLGPPRAKRETVRGARCHPDHSIWRGIRKRCSKPKAAGYEYYGGKGVTVCAEWQSSFAAFKRDMGPRKHTIDRIDNSMGYEPGNCRWATMKEQERNRSNNRLVDWEGETITASELAERAGVSAALVISRLRLGWSPLKAITVPKRAKAPNGRGQRKKPQAA